MLVTRGKNVLDALFNQLDPDYPFTWDLRSKPRLNMSSRNNRTNEEMYY